MQIQKGIELSGLTLFLEKEKILVVGDVHIGYEEALNKQGVLIPRLIFKEIMSEIKEAIEKHKPKTIILLGDVKHEFGRISGQEWKETLMFLDFLMRHSKVIVLKGNHDAVGKALMSKRGLFVLDYYFENGYFFCHGDRFFDKEVDFKKAKTIIMGHEHPAISLKDGFRTEKYKCFLKGKYKLKNLIVVPSFNRLTFGSDVLQTKPLSPMIKDFDGFEVFIAGDESYNFGKISKLRKKLL